MVINPKIIIIGAGAAGYSAACRLLEKNITNVIILEAENRIGGRVYSCSFGEANVDLGAQWCHGEKENIVFDMVKNLNLLASSFVNYQNYLFVDSKGNFVDNNTAELLVNIAFSIEDDDEEMKKGSGSFGHYFIKRFNEELDHITVDEDKANQVSDWFQKFFNSINASSTWFDVSASGLTQYIACEGNSTLNWKGKGYQTIFAVLKKQIPDPTEELPVDKLIQFNKEVCKIVWDTEEVKNGNVQVDCIDGSSYNADHVIITTSLGVLKDNYQKMFVPNLPSYKENAIEGLAIGTVNKIILKFPVKWWPDDCPGFSLIWTEEDSNKVASQFSNDPCKDGKSWLENIFGFYPVDDNPNVLIGWLVGHLGPEVELLSDKTVLDGCKFLLDKFLGSHFTITPPDAILRSKWHSNPHFRGSYSYRSLETDRRDTCAADLARPLSSGDKNVLLFAGEATHSRFFSTVHGAIESGFREADRILDMYKFGQVPRSKL